MTGCLDTTQKNALDAWTYYLINGKRENLSRHRIPRKQKSISSEIPTRQECDSFYGTPGNQVNSRLVYLRLPFDLRIDWNLKQKTSRILIHRKTAPYLENAMLEIHKRYGMEDMRKLGLDRYAGAYNHRKIRGSTKWSMHAYGCAIDFYAGPNGLRTKCPDALFCKEVYRDFIDIMEENRMLSLGRMIGRDWMHFQMCR